MRRRSCGLALIAAVGLAAGGAAQAAHRVVRALHPIASGHYAGKTRQHRPISFDISATGKRVVHPILYLQTSCPGATKPSHAATSPRSTATASGLIRHGRFSFHFTERARVSNGYTATARFLLRGHFRSRRRAKGKVSVTVTYVGKSRIVCTSGNVKFSVHS